MTSKEFDLDKKLKTAMGFIRTLVREIDKLELTMGEQALCNLFHHNRQDRHDFDKPCPVVRRHIQIIVNAKGFLDG